MRKLTIISLSFFVLGAYAQETDVWQILSDVTFETKTDNNQKIDVPTFGKRVQSLQGRNITLSGYLVPLSEYGGNNEFMLSSLPLNACFFCGGAGPETIVELKVKESLKFTTARITMAGTLVLNDRDPDHHIYILKDATIIH